MNPLWCFVLVFVLGLVIAPAVVAGAQPGEVSGSTDALGLRFAAVLSSMFGETAYELNAKSEDPANPGTLVDIRSRLEFPLDATLLGLVAHWMPGRGPSRRWTLTAGVHTNVTDPSNNMTDEDWIASKQISYTESPAELDMILATAEVKYHLRPQQRTAIDLLFHFDYQRIDQYLVGFEGWRGSLFSDQRFPVSGTAPVIDYEVEYLSPQLGAAATHQIGGHYSLGGQATAGIVYASDTDDHLLRGRIAEGNGLGFGLNSRVEFSLLPGFVPLRWLSADLVGELRFFHAEGDVTQRWYRDEDLPAGTVIADIPYEFESLQVQVGVSVGASF